MTRANPSGGYMVPRDGVKAIEEAEVHATRV